MFSLIQHGHEAIPVGNKKATVAGAVILHELPDEKVDTITVYVGPQHLKTWIEPIALAQPNRIIFNPGTENSEAMEYWTKRGIACIEACTLVLLATGQF